MIKFDFIFHIVEIFLKLLATVCNAQIFIDMNKIKETDRKKAKIFIDQKLESFLVLTALQSDAFGDAFFLFERLITLDHTHSRIHRDH